MKSDPFKWNVVHHMGMTIKLFKYVIWKSMYIVLSIKTQQTVKYFAWKVCSRVKISYLLLYSTSAH